MTKDEALKLALEFIERVNQDGWILADFELQMYAAIAAIKKALTQQEQGRPVAMLERDPSIGRLRVTYEDAVTELDEGFYPLYTQTETGCAECGIGGGHALYCVACAEVALKNWVGLTDEEIQGCIEATIEITDTVLLDAVNAVIIDVEGLLREKNK